MNFSDFRDYLVNCMDTQIVDDFDAFKFNPDSDFYVYGFCPLKSVVIPAGYFVKIGNYYSHIVIYNQTMILGEQQSLLTNSWMKSRIVQSYYFLKNIRVVTRKIRPSILLPNWYNFDYTAILYHNKISYYTIYNAMKLIILVYDRRLGKVSYDILKHSYAGGKNIILCLKKWCLYNRAYIETYIFSDIDHKFLEIL